MQNKEPDSIPCVHQIPKQMSNFFKLFFQSNNSPKLRTHPGTRLKEGGTQKKYPVFKHYNSAWLNTKILPQFVKRKSVNNA